MENRGTFEKRQGFVIFASPRSGSTTLANMIASQGYSVCYEPFNHVLKKEYYHKLIKEGEGVIPSLMENYDCVKHLSGHGGERIDRCLLKYKSMILKRKNIIKSALSYCISSKIGIWKAKELVGGEFDKLGSIDIMHIRAAMGRIRHINKYNADKVVYYEDLYGNESKKEISDIFDYFGISIKNWNAIDSCMDIKNKMNSDETYNKIKNIDEIRKLGSEEIGYL